MKDTKLLELLADYEFLRYSRTSLMLGAREYYEEGDMDHSWAQLFFWCMAGDELAKAWHKLRDDYVKALGLKEGWE